MIEPSYKDRYSTNCVRLYYISMARFIVSCYYLKCPNFFLICIFSDYVCPSIGHPRKDVVCYYDGKRPVSSLYVCLCTHIIYTSVGLNEIAKLHLSDSKYKTTLNSIKLPMKINRMFIIILKQELMRF